MLAPASKFSRLLLFPSHSRMARIQDGASSQRCRRTNPTRSSRARPPFSSRALLFHPRAPSSPARGTFSSRARRLFARAASFRRFGDAFGERGDAIRTEAMASPTPRLENRRDAIRTMLIIIFYVTLFKVPFPIQYYRTT
jgi:hypothetical protein